jgi:hypothetical protein
VLLFSTLAATTIYAEDAGAGTRSAAKGAYSGRAYNSSLVSLAPCPAWTAVPSANSGAGDNVLNSVSASSATDIWAVGYDGSGSNAKTLVTRWDGKSWQVVPSPNPQSGNNFLEAVAAIAPNNVWAVGLWSTRDDSGSFILNWTGQEWKESRLPDLNPQTQLYTISARSANDIWAVGSLYDPGRKREGVVTLHYNGVDWQVVPTRTGNYSDALYGVVAIAPNDAWAVGYIGGGGAITMHWNGTEWGANNPPSRNGRQYVLSAVTATAANDVWAVGYSRAHQANSKPTLLINHWNGSFWTESKLDNPSEEGSVLFGVAAASPTDIWAVGYFVASGQRRTLLMHYDGANWSKVSTGDAGEGATLYSVAVPGGGNSPGEPVAVGYSTSGARRTLMRRNALLALISIFSLLLLAACSPQAALTEADQAIQTADDLIKKANTTLERIEQVKQRAQQLKEDFNLETLPSIVQPAGSKATELWQDLKKSSLCASLKSMVQDGQLPDKQKVIDFINEKLGAGEYAPINNGGSPEQTKEEVDALAQQVTDITNQIDTTRQDDQDTFAALLIELGCVPPPTTP